MRNFRVLRLESMHLDDASMIIIRAVWEKIKMDRKASICKHLESACSPDIRDCPEVKVALKETLYRLPECVYSFLTDDNKPLLFLPSEDVGSQTCFSRSGSDNFTFEEGINFVILQCNQLEKVPKEAIIGVIAHELAHAYLHFYNKGESEKDRRDRNKEAENIAKEWDFVEETQAYHREFL